MSETSVESATQVEATQVPEKAALEAVQKINQSWKEQLVGALNVDLDVQIAGGQTAGPTEAKDALAESTEIYRVTLKVEGDGEFFIAFQDGPDSPFLADLLEASDAGRLLPLAESYANSLAELLRTSNPDVSVGGVELADLFSVAPHDQAYVAATGVVSSGGNELSTVQVLPLNLVSRLLAGAQTVASEPQEEEKTETVPVQEAEFQAFPRDDQSAEASATANLEMLYGLKLDITVELGRTRMPVRDVLKLGRGAIVELSSLPGDPVDIFVNGRKFAEGEVVVVEEHFGVRITHLINPAERAQKVEETT
jgi:flagellar motor switch protein FliN